MRSRNGNAVRRRGGVLIVVLVMLVVLTSLVLLMAQSMRTEAAGASNEMARLKAEAVADGAVVYLRALLAATPGVLPPDASLQREAVRVGDGYFWLLKHDVTQLQGGYTFGITDEASKLNINRASGDALSRLPNMTQELGYSIVDWRDPDEEMGIGGAESSYYLSLAPSYGAKNESFYSLDELLMVKGFTRAVLYGGDKNRNMVQDPGETAPSVTGGSNSFQAASQISGVADYLTVYSAPYVSTSTTTGTTPLINVNGGSGELMALISQTVGDRAGTVMGNIIQGRPHRNLLDFYVKSGMTLEQFKSIANKLTAAMPGSNATVAGLVNLNTASKEVLMTLGDMTESDAQTIAGRQADGTGFSSIVDLLDLLPAARAVSIGGLVDVRPGGVSADIVAVDGSGRGFKRMKVVMGMNGNVAFVQDLTGLGWPLDPAILMELKAGRTPPVTGGMARVSGTGSKGNQ